MTSPLDLLSFPSAILSFLFGESGRPVSNGCAVWMELDGMSREEQVVQGKANILAFQTQNLNCEEKNLVHRNECEEMRMVGGEQGIHCHDVSLAVLISAHFGVSGCF